MYGQARNLTKAQILCYLSLLCGRKVEYIIRIICGFFLKIFNIYACIIKMTSYALLLCSNLINTPVKEVIEPLIYIFGVRLPVTLNSGF